MSVLKTMGRVLVFPVMIVVTVIQWVFTVITDISSIVFKILAGLFLMIAVLSKIVGIMTWSEALRPVLVSLITYLTPVIGKGITAVIAIIREALLGFIWS